MLHGVLAVLLVAGCAAQEERQVVPGTEVARYDVGGGTTFVLVRREVEGAYDSYTGRNLTREERAVYALDGRPIVPFRFASDLEVVVTEPPHTFALAPNSTTPYQRFDGVWQRLTPEGAEPLPFTEAEPITTPGGPRRRVVGPRLLAICGPDLDVARAERRFDHVAEVEPIGGGGYYFWVQCRWTEQDGAERLAATIVDGLLEPVSPPGAALRHEAYAQGFPRRIYVWWAPDGWRLLGPTGVPMLKTPARDLVPGPDPRPGGYTLGFVAVHDGPDGAPARSLLDELGGVRCEGLRAAQVLTVRNTAYTGPHPDRIGWEREGAARSLGFGYFDWTPEYGVWLIERGDGVFDVRFPDDDWKTMATGPTAAAAMAAAEGAVTARVREARDRQVRDRAAFDAYLQAQREAEAREAAQAAEARRRHEAALATWRADHEAAWARARAEIEQNRQALEAWSRSWEEKGSTPFYSSSSGGGGDDAAHRARLAETEATTRRLERETRLFDRQR
ncbi:MAG: hypothetical protein KF878_06045 [Planctomycetes bacterium]|nr:hypothetical protein [Planctomycetota bacterium]